MFQKFYQNKKVLVTGHTGFKGSWLTLWLKELGANVAGFSNEIPTEPSHFKAIGLQDKIQHFQGDIRKKEEVQKVIQSFKPDIVFHLAAEAIVLKCYSEPVLAFETNVIGTVNILDCIRQLPSIESAVMITSDKCYENVEWDWGYREIDKLGGKDPYSASKACAELIISSFVRSYFTTGQTQVASTRAGNVIGGGDWAQDRIIPDAMRSWSQNKILSIRSPQATRPWQHVLEPLSGYLWLGKLLSEKNQNLNGQPFNFGPAADANYSVKELLDEMKKYWKGDFSVEAQNTQKKEAGLLKLSCDKALRQLQWKSCLDFSTTVQMTAEWYRSYYEKEDVLKLGIKQIQDYAQKARTLKIPWA